MIAQTIEPSGSKTEKAHIVGVVVDSLNFRYLSDADVVVEGAHQPLHTDSLGRFRIDSLPPGTYRVGVFHPLLDALNIELSTPPFHLGIDSSSFVTLAVPSAATIIRRMCPTRSDVAGTSAVLGRVNDPETSRPVDRAEVIVAWADLEISKEHGIQRTGRSVRDTTDATGQFRLCGLPSSLNATLQARHGAAATAEIPITLDARPTQLLARMLLLSAADSGSSRGKATVSGVVVLENSSTKAPSRVELAGTDIVAMTDEKGEFTLRNLPSGSAVLLARHLGFGSQTVPVDLSSRRQARVTITLPKYLTVMDPVLVLARRQRALDQAGFSQRRKAGFGYFIGPERLQTMHPNRLTDILADVPSLDVSYGHTCQADGRMPTARPGDTTKSDSPQIIIPTCTPDREIVFSRRDIRGCVRYFVDDAPFPESEPGDINDFVTGGEVVAVEVYEPVEAPARYGNGSGCVTIVLWTHFRIRAE
jgi:hypothetical protein